jgi:hypothetical protein
MIFLRAFQRGKKKAILTIHLYFDIFNIIFFVF